LHDGLELNASKTVMELQELSLAHREVPQSAALEQVRCKFSDALSVEPEKTISLISQFLIF
jgi:hypothetical protein